MIRSRLRQTMIGALAGGLLLGGCTPTVDIRGNLPPEYKLAKLESSGLKRSDVSALLGSPSAVATFDSEVWYYIGQKTETLAFFAPRIIDQQVLAVTFDTNGAIAEVRRYRREDGRAIEPVGRTTPTAGKELNVIEQLLGNVGRFSSTDK